MDVLRLIATGKVNAGTAAMQSFGSDQVGVETGQMDGFEMSSGAEAELYHHMSHFFTTGVPEITYFGPENSLETHGAQMTALHFMKGRAHRLFHVGSPSRPPTRTFAYRSARCRISSSSRRDVAWGISATKIDPSLA